jgi:IS5 family transposase
LAEVIEWKTFEQEFGVLYSPDEGRPGKMIRLMVGLHYLKHAFDKSDEEVVSRWVENPYWQYFCGEEYFQHELPIDPSLMTKWRNRVRSGGLEKLLEETVKAGLRIKAIKKREMSRVVVDTTVQEKAIAFPTDARLYHRMREKLVKLSKQHGVFLRQSYKRKGKEALLMHSRYAHAKQYKRAGRSLRKQRTYLGRVVRDIERKTANEIEKTTIFSEYLEMAHRLLEQQRYDKNKLYSIHAPEVVCISKGKSHKRYEFGCKVGLVTTMKNPFVLGIQAFTGNSYDGHTLAASIEQAQRISSFKAKEVFVDRGYRGHDYRGDAKVHIVGRGLRKLPRTLRKWFKRRSVIEPVIGHVKQDCRLARNYLKGTEGDRMNAILCGCGYNIRKLLREFLFFLKKLGAQTNVWSPIWLFFSRYRNFLRSFSLSPS